MNCPLPLTDFNEIREHLTRAWPGRETECFAWTLGRIEQVLPGFRVLRIKPSSESQAWVYASIGMSVLPTSNNHPLELFILSPWEEALHVELLAMLAHYQADPALEIGLHSVLPIGREWIEGSACDHFLISLPFTVGPKLEWMLKDEQPRVRFLWALPITKAEADFAKVHGVEALEARFDSLKINAVDPNRASVV